VGLLALACLSQAGPSTQRKVPFDWTGQVSCVLAIGALTFGSIEAGAQGLDAAPVMAALVLALAALGAFVLSQRRGAHPMVPRQLFESPNAAIAMAVGFAFMVGYFGLPFLMSLYLQQQRGVSALLTGQSFLPMMLAGLALTPFSARLAERFGARNMIATGLMAMAAGLAFIAAIPPNAPLPLYSLAMILVGLAGPLIAPPITAVLLASVPAHLAGTASGVYNTSRQLGGALAVALFGALVGGSATFSAGMRTSLLIAAAVAMAAAAASFGLQSPSAARALR
jgi:MFS family permease